MGVDVRVDLMRRDVLTNTDLRGRGRRGDVGDGRDVVPVEPVPDPQQEARHEDTETGSGERGVGRHVRTSRYCIVLR